MKILLRIMLVYALLCTNAQAADIASVEQQLPTDLQLLTEPVVKVEAWADEKVFSSTQLGTYRVATGTIIDSQGLILTTALTIEQADKIEVTLKTGETLPTEVLGKDFSINVAILKVNYPKPLTAAQFNTEVETSKELPSVVVPHESADMAVARVAKLSKYTTGWEFELNKGIFTTPAILEFAGAPLFNLQGEVIGIGHDLTIDIDISPKIRVPGNIFIPTEAIFKNMGKLLTATTESNRPWLGATFRQKKNEITITRVQEGSPASKVLKAGDVILGVDNRKLTSISHFYAMIWQHDAEKPSLNLLIYREPYYKTVEVDKTSYTEWIEEYDEQS